MLKILIYRYPLPSLVAGHGAIARERGTTRSPTAQIIFAGMHVTHAPTVAV